MAADIPPCADGTLSGQPCAVPISRSKRRQMRDRRVAVRRSQKSTMVLRELLNGENVDSCTPAGEGSYSSESCVQRMSRLEHKVDTMSSMVWAVWELVHESLAHRPLQQELLLESLVSNDVDRHLHSSLNKDAVEFVPN